MRHVRRTADKGFDTRSWKSRRIRKSEVARTGGSRFDGFSLSEMAHTAIWPKNCFVKIRIVPPSVWRIRVKGYCAARIFDPTWSIDGSTRKRIFKILIVDRFHDGNV
jgi:hypothetical protein